MAFIKDEAKKAIDNLPEQATWDDIMYHLYVKKKIATALEAVNDGQALPHDEVKARFLKK